MRMRWFLLALRPALPVTVPAAVPCTHLAMHGFLLQNSSSETSAIQAWHSRVLALQHCFF